VTIAQFACKHVITIAVGATLEEAAEKMLTNNVGALVVTDGSDEHSAVVGILTDRDIVRARLHHSSALSALDVADVMTRDPLSIRGSDSLAGAIRHMRARGVRRAPVVASDGRLIGMVSIDDLLREIAGDLCALAQVVATQGRGSSR
jgi:CBS domain-containing protein